MIFLFFGLGWIFVILNIILLEFSISAVDIFSRAGFILISSTSLFVILLLFLFFSPSNVGKGLYMGVILFLIAMFVYPVYYENHDFVFSLEQQIVMGVNSIIHFICALIFIFFYFNKKTKEIIRQKALLFGTGLFLINFGPFYLL